MVARLKRLGNGAAFQDTGGFLRHNGGNFTSAQTSQRRGVEKSRLADHKHDRPKPSLPKLKFMGETDGEDNAEREDGRGRPGQR